MKQQADKEMVAMRRIIETLNDLEPSARTRVMAFVNDRVLINPPIEKATNEPQEKPKAPVVGELPFPDAERVKAVINGNGASDGIPLGLAGLGARNG